MRLLFLLFVTLLNPFLAYANTLTIETKDSTKVSFTIDDLKAMPETSYTTPLPWIEGESTFTGVRLDYLMTQVTGTTPDTLRLRALNDYAANVVKADIEKYVPIIAYHRDGHPMRVRDKGPFWLIYSLKLHPELDTPRYQGQMVWQLETIKVVNDDK